MFYMPTAADLTATYYPPSLTTQREIARALARESDRLIDLFAAAVAATRAEALLSHRVACRTLHDLGGEIVGYELAVEPRERRD